MTKEEWILEGAKRMEQLVRTPYATQTLLKEAKKWLTKKPTDAGEKVYHWDDVTK